MPHPATMFFLLTLAVILLSWIFDVYGLSVLQPQTGEEIRVQSLLSPDVFGGSFCVIGISLETHSFLFCKFYGSVKEKNTMSGSNKLA